MNWLANLGPIAALLGAAGLGGLLKAWLDHRRDVLKQADNHKEVSRKQSDEVALTLVAKLEGRVEKLEADLEEERRRCDGELRILRHRASNQRMMIYSLLHLFDVPANQRKNMLADIREQLASFESAEAIEKGVAVAAGLKEAEHDN